MPLLVTYGRRDGQLESGSDARTYSLEIGGSEANTADHPAPSGSNVVSLLPDADCWVAIGRPGGDNPANAESGVRRRPLQADVMRRFSVREGDVVSVVSR